MAIPPIGPIVNALSFRGVFARRGASCVPPSAGAEGFDEDPMPGGFCRRITGGGRQADTAAEGASDLSFRNSS